MIERLKPIARKWLPWLFAAAVLGTFIGRAVIIPRHVHNIGFGEHNVIDGIIRLLEGEALYGDPDRPPYDIIQYSPIIYYVCAGIAAPLGLGKEDPQTLFILCRIVCLVANLLMCVLIWRLGAHLRFAPWARWMLIGLIFTWMHEPYFSRPDSLYQLFCVMLLGSGLKAFDRDELSWQHAWKLGLFSMLVLFSKQSGVGPVAAVGAGFLFAGRWSSVLRFGIAAAVCNVAALAAISAFDGFHNVYANLVLGNVNGYTFPFWAWIPDEPYMGMGYWITPVAFLVAWRMRHDPPARPPFLWVAMLITYLWAFATAGKVGSNVNYFMEHWLLCGVVCLLFVQRAGASPMLRFGLVAGLSAVFLLRAAWFTKVFAFSDYPEDERVNYMDDLAAASALREHGLRPGDGVFIVGQRSYLDQALGTQAWLKHKDIFRQSGASLPFDHSAAFDNTRNAALRFVLTADTSAAPGMGDEVFTGWAPSFRAGRYTVYERAH